MGVEINDILGLEKVAEAMKYILGPWVEKKRMVKIAEGKNKEINEISDAIRNNMDMDIAYEDGKCSIESRSNEDLLARAKERIVEREIYRQLNLESIAAKTLAQLRNGNKEVSKEKISFDWMKKFANYAQDISDEYVQDIWSKLLTEEIVNTGAISIKTLSVLSCLNHDDVVTFQEITKYIFDNSAVINNEELMRNWDISYDDILRMDEADLINSSGMLMYQKKIDNNHNIILDFNRYLLLGEVDDSVTIKLQVFRLTRAGKELCSIIGDPFDHESMISISKYISEKYKNVKISLCKVKKRYDGIIETETSNVVDEL